MPNKIHQIWIQGLDHFKEHQPEFYKYSLLWKQIYPDFEYKLWSEVDYIDLMDEELKISYDKAPSFSAKSDIARYTILCKEGGLYADTDYEPFKRCSYLFNDNEVDLVAIAMNLSKNRLLFGNYKFGTAWIYGKQNFVLFETLLSSFRKNPYDPKKWTKFQYAWEITGPKAFGDAIEKLDLFQNERVRILPHSLIEVADFSNCAITSRPRSAILNEFPFAVGIHRMDGSWIKNAHGVKTTFGEFYTWFTSWSDFVSIGLVVTLLTVAVCFLIFGLYKRKTCKR